MFTPRMFSMQISKMYYSDAWDKAGNTNAEGTFSNQFDQIMCAEKSNCRILGNQHFSDEEKQQISIG